MSVSIEDELDGKILMIDEKWSEYCHRTYHHVKLHARLQLLAERLHEGPGVHALARHALIPEIQSAIAPGFVQHYQIHYLLALCVVEHCLRLAGDPVRPIECAHDHARAVGEELEDAGLHLVGS